MIATGKLDRRATFAEPFKDKDADGKVIQRHVDQFAVWANSRWLRGGETVMQARMQSRSPAIVTIRSSPDSARITSEWKMFMDGREFDVKERPRLTDDRAFYELMVEAMS